MLSAALCSADGPPPGNTLTDASLEELMSMEVTSVARKKQMLSRAAAAVYVVTQDDIRRAGATSIPEALRMVPGLFVGQIDSSKWAISARGRAGRYANKMLVLIDGRSVYTELFSGVWWDQADVMIEDVERIEVIRGPGGTMWGANAVNGVINIITKQAKNTQGLMASATTGTQDRGIGAVRYGGRVGDSVNYRLFSKYLDRGKLYADGPPSNDAWGMFRAGGRLDWEATPGDLLTFQGDAFAGREGQQVYASFPMIGLSPPVSDHPTNSGGYGLGRWERTFSERSDLALQAYVYQENRTEGLASIRSTTVDFDFQDRFAAGSRNDVLWGLSFRTVGDRLTQGAILRQSLFHPERRTDNLYSAFVQNDLAVVPNVLTFTFGTKFEHNGYSGFNAQPSLRLLWTPNRRHTFWAAASQAVRTPSRRDVDLTWTFALPPPAPSYAVGSLQGNPAFGDETVRAYEAGWRWQVNHIVSLDFATYWNSYRDLQVVLMGDPRLVTSPQFGVTVPFTFANSGRETTKGLEVASNWKLRRDLSLLLNYTYFGAGITRMIPGAVSLGEGNADTFPRNQAQSRLSWDFQRHKSVDFSFYAVSPMRDIGIPGYLRTDIHLAWRTAEDQEWSLGVQNAFRDHHAEFLAEDYVRSLEPRRSLYLRYVWGL